MKMHIIASGSKGNASIVYDDSTCILIDCGISKKRLVEGLKEVNKALNDIDFVLFTHNHIDHILGESYFSLDKKYARKGTINLLQNHELVFNHIYTFKDFEVELLETSHDAIAPCGFLFKNKDESLVYITDSGFIPETTFKLIKDKTYYFIESNHDYDMLINSNRPLILKKRILSDYGHLSNYQSATYMSLLIGSDTKKIILAHLSEECNTPNEALNTYYSIFKNEGIATSCIKIICAKQHESVDL